MNPKYKLTDETKVNDAGITLHRIEALCSFGNVKAGDKGGWIEAERNLSQTGISWIYDNAEVWDHARICQNARVRNYAKVYGHAVVTGFACVSFDANVFDDAHIYEHAQIKDHAQVHENARVHGDADIVHTSVVNGHANIFENACINGATITDDALVYGKARILGHCTVMECAVVSGTSVLTGHVVILGNAKISGSACIEDMVQIEGNAIVNGDVAICGNVQLIKDAVITKPNDYTIVGPIYNPHTNTYFHITFFRNSEDTISLTYDGDNVFLYEDFLEKLSKEYGTDDKFAIMCNNAAKYALEQMSLIF